MLPTPMQVDIVTVVLSNPALLAALAVAIYAISGWQRTLTYYEYRVLNSGRIFLFALFNPLARRLGRPLIINVAGETTAAHVDTVDTPFRATIHSLREYGFEFHLLATVKRVQIGNNTYTAQAQLYYPERADGDRIQTEVFLLEVTDGTGVYAHVEPGVTTPEDHLDGIIRSGDGRGHVTAALGLDPDGTPEETA